MVLDLIFLKIDLEILWMKKHDCWKTLKQVITGYFLETARYVITSYWACDKQYYMEYYYPYICGLALYILKNFG